MSVLLGFDTAAPITPGLWQALSAALGQPPRVVNGYLDAFPITREQVAFVQAQGASINLCANGTGPAIVQGSFAEGYAFAELRAAKARALGAPPGVGIAVDVEADWEPAGDWLAGFTAGTVAGGYRPLAYGVPRRAAFSGALQAAGERYAVVRERLAVWSATPEPGGAPAVPAWNPDPCAGLPVVGWQWQENWVLPGGQAVDLDLWQEGFAGLWPPRAGPSPWSRLALLLCRWLAALLAGATPADW